MRGWWVALQSEIFIGVRSLGDRLVVLMPSALVLAQYLLTSLRETGAAARDSLLGRSDFDQDLANNAYGHFVDGLDTGLTLLALLLVAQAAYSFSGERDSGALRHLLIRASSRRALLLAKLVYLHLVGLLALLLLLLICYLASTLLGEFSAVVEDGFELIGEQEIRQEIALGLRLALLPFPVAIALGLLISVAAHTATQAVVLALGLTLLLDLFKSTLGDYALYLYATYLPSLLDQSYLEDVGRLVRGFSDVLIDERFLQLNAQVPLPSLLVLLVLLLLTVQARKL